MNLSILYRGPLSSCNYACDYCPFAKHTETPAELAHDRECLERFVNWVASREPSAPPTSQRPATDHSDTSVAGLCEAGTIGILFTPWGEALVRKWYQDALATLTRMPHVRKAAIQTNLSCKLDWVEDCNKSKLALWCTFHPTETTRDRFLAKCRELLDRGVRFSVGVVGLKEHLAEIEELRRALPPEVYLWVNAYKRGDPSPTPPPRGEGLKPVTDSSPPSLRGKGAGGLGSSLTNYYTPEMIADLTRIDPLFPLNNTYHASRREACRAGASVISVDGEGTVRRCHFIKTPIGNIYSPDFENCLRERPCANDTCGCHIGYVHLDRLNLYETFGDGVLERIPLGYR